MELVRKILFELEKRDDDSVEFVMPGVDNAKLRYHLRIMEQAGLVDTNIQAAGDNMFWIYASLSWNGHVFLDSLKSDNVWDKTKEFLKEKGLELGAIPLEVL